MEVVTKSAEETKELGEKIATDLVKGPRPRQAKRGGQKSKVKSSAKVLALTGELGSGKTTFVQGLAKGFGIKTRIISPTFILMRKYNISPNTDREAPSSAYHEAPSSAYHGTQYTDFYHIDLYRLERNVEKEVRNMGIEDVWNDPGNVVAIEWAEKIEKMVPKSAKWVKFENLGGDKRKLTMK